MSVITEAQNNEMIKLGVSLGREHGLVCIPTANKIPLVRGWQKFGETYVGPKSFER